MPLGVGAFLRDSLQVTAAVVLRPLGEGRAQFHLIDVQALSGLASIEIDPARLVLPPGFAETQWPGFERAFPV